MDGWINLRSAYKFCIKPELWINISSPFFTKVTGKNILKWTLPPRKTISGFYKWNLRLLNTFKGFFWLKSVLIKTSKHLQIPRTWSCMRHSNFVFIKSNQEDETDSLCRVIVEETVKLQGAKEWRMLLKNPIYVDSSKTLPTALNRKQLFMSVFTSWRTRVPARKATWPRWCSREVERGCTNTNTKTKTNTMYQTPYYQQCKQRASTTVVNHWNTKAFLSKKKKTTHS